MLASKPNNPSGLSEGSSHKQPSNRRATSAAAPRVSRLAKPASKPADRAPSPLHHRHALDRSSASIDLHTPTTKPSPGGGGGGGGAAERRSFKASPASRGSTTFQKQQQPTAAKTSSELQAQLTLVQEDLRTAREHLASIENDRAQILDDLAVARRLAADAQGKLEESLLARRRAEEALELERFESTEREQSAVDLAHRTEDEWRSKYDGVRKRHAEDVASLIATARELDAVRDELAATAQARDSALNRAGELQEIADGNADKAEALTAEMARLKSRLAAELEKNAKEAAETIEKLESEASALQGKAAASEKEAIEYKERFLETSRRLEVAAEEARELQAAIDGLRSEHQLLHEAHQRTVGAEKTASAQVGHLTEDENRLLRELADTREERDKVKKAVEDLAAALRQVSSEAREAKESVLAKQAELDDARLQMSELKAAMENAEERYQFRMPSSEAKISKDSKEADMLKRSGDGVSSIQLEMSKLTESLRAAENEVQELRADKTQLLNKLQEFQVQAMNSEEEAKAESSQLKDLLSSKDNELLALNHELTELRFRESAALEKASEVSKLLAEMTARKAEEESTKALQAKLELDSVLESLKAAEGEAKAAKEEKAQLQNKVRLLESKITEANLTSEEAKMSSLRLKETLEGKEHELASIVQENREMRAREAAAHAKIDELAVLLAEATARKGGELSNGAAAAATVTRSSQKQPSVFLKLNCSPMHHNVRDDENNGEIAIQNQEEDIKHVDEVETVRQVKHDKERAAVDASSLEKSKIVEDDLSKERDDGDAESSDDDGGDESAGDDALVDQMNGLLIRGPTSSFNRDQRVVQKKKRALLKRFGSLLKKRAHFTKLSSHSHS